MFLSNSSLSFLYTKAFPDKCYIQSPSLISPDLILTPTQSYPEFLTPIYPTPKFLTPIYPTPKILTPFYSYPTFPTPSSILPDFLKPKYSYPNLLKPILTFPKILTPTFFYPNLLNPILTLPKLLTTPNLLLILTSILNVPSTPQLPHFSTLTLPLPLLFPLHPSLIHPLPYYLPFSYSILPNLCYLTLSLTLPISLTILILKMSSRAIPPNPTYPDQNPLTYHDILKDPVPQSHPTILLPIPLQLPDIPVHLPCT